MTRGMRALGGAALLMAVWALALLASVRWGAVGLSTAQVMQALLGEGPGTAVTIVRELRLPRALQASLVGAMLAASGATFQALLRNPLADPYVLGVSSGAAMGAVAALALGGPWAQPWTLPWAAFAGAVAALLLVLALASRAPSGWDARTVVLAGVGVSAFGGAVVLLLLSFVRDVETFRAAVLWTMGSLAAASWTSVAVLAAYAVPGLALLWAGGRALNALSLGEDTAAYLGVRVVAVQRTLAAVAALLAAAAVALSGVIGFVGLIVPHAARMLWGSEHRRLLPVAALLGATFLLLADLVARLAAAPGELPIGVVTALLGVPCFLWLVQRRARP